MTRKTLTATATAIFAAGSLRGGRAGPACRWREVQRRQFMQGHERLQDRLSSCKGQNACKGQGWTETTDVVSCTTQGGKVVQ